MLDINTLSAAKNLIPATPNSSTYRSENSISGKNQESEKLLEQNAQKISSTGYKLTLANQKPLKAKNEAENEAVIENKTKDATEFENRQTWVIQVKAQILEQQKQLLIAGLNLQDSETASLFASSKDADKQNSEIIKVPEALVNNQAIPLDSVDSGSNSNSAEYWNAENTSQRIVNFATNFISSVGGQDSAFAQTLRDAIAEGFRQAQGITGALPGAAGKLYEDTFTATFNKFDKWVEEFKASPYTQKTGNPLTAN